MVKYFHIAYSLHEREIRLRTDKVPNCEISDTLVLLGNVVSFIRLVTCKVLPPIADINNSKVTEY